MQTIRNRCSNLLQMVDQYTLVAFVIIASLLVGLIPAAAQEEPTLPTIDPQPIFDGIETYLPWVFAILAIPAGIMIAVRIAKFVISAFDGAFNS